MNHTEISQASQEAMQTIERLVEQGIEGYEIALHLLQTTQLTRDEAMLSLQQCGFSVTPTNSQLDIPSRNGFFVSVKPGEKISQYGAARRKVIWNRSLPKSSPEEGNR